MEDGKHQDIYKQLFSACQQGDVDTVQHILDNSDFSYGVDIDAGEGFTPLQLAAGGGQENVVRLLLMRGAMLDSKNSYGWTPLMQAASCGHAHIVALLLQNKADPNTRNKLGASALTLAALGGHLSVVRTLLDYPGVDLNDVQKEGQAMTPLMGSALHGCESILKLLMDRGSDHFHVEKSTGWTNLMMSALGGTQSVTELLLDNGVDPNASDINQRTALDIANLHDNTEVKEVLEGKTLNKGKGTGFEKRIIEATEAGNESQVLQLLDEDPSQCNATSKEGATPLMIAAMLGYQTLVEILVQRGADVNRQDTKSGWTALMQATFHRKLGIVQYLVRVGADVTIQASDGCRALDLALVIINNESDKSGDELIHILASATMPSNVETANGPTGLQGSKSMVTESHLIEDDSKGGLKKGKLDMHSLPVWSLDTVSRLLAGQRVGRLRQILFSLLVHRASCSLSLLVQAWWSRMSNRFRNLKLTRTLRAGFSTTKLAPMEDETIPLDKTLCSVDVSPSKSHLSGDNRHRRKSKDSKSVEFNLENITRKDSGYGDTQSLKSVSTLPSSFRPSDDKLPSVIPPFLPPPTFEFQNSDKNRRHSQPSIKSMRTTLSSQKTGQIRTNSKPNKLLFTRRSIAGVSPSNSLHNSTTISPNSSGNSSAFSYGRLTSGGLISLSSLTNRDKVMRFEGNDLKDSEKVMKVKEKPSDELARYQQANSGVIHTASSTSSTLSGSVQPPVNLHIKNKKASRGTGSTTSTLTPSPPPTLQYYPPKEKHSRASELFPTKEDVFTKGSSSSGVSDEDELSVLLKKLSLERYAPIFEDQEVDMDAFLALNESDLLEMGIDGSGHRRQLMNVITKLNSGQP